MELYDKDYFSGVLKKWKSEDKVELKRRLAYVFINVSFFITYVEGSLIPAMTGWVLFSFFIVLPFVLILRIVYKKRSYSYLIVLGYLMVSLVFAIEELWSTHSLLMDQLKGDVLMCSCNPSADFVELLTLIGLLSFTLVLLGMKVVRSQIIFSPMNWIRIPVLTMAVIYGLLMGPKLYIYLSSLL